MSNHICLEPTRFVNVRSGDESLGVRVYDDEGCYYDNSWVSIPDDDLEVLRETLSSALSSANDDVLTVLFCVRDGKRGLFIGGVWYDWVQVKSCFD